MPGWSPGTHGTTYEPPAATAAKAPGYQTTMRSRRTLVNCEIYIHTHRSAITGRWRDCSRERPRGVAPRDGRRTTKKNQKNIKKISRRILKKIVRKIGCLPVPGWSPGTHGTTYEPPAATAAKAPGYQTTMRSRRTLVNCEIYIHHTGQPSRAAGATVRASGQEE